MQQVSRWSAAQAATVVTITVMIAITTIAKPRKVQIHAIEAIRPPQRAGVLAAALDSEVVGHCREQRASSY